MINLLLTIVVSMTANAGILEDFDTLGGNKDLLNKVQQTKADSKVQIVQKRVVDRNFRHEFYPEYSYNLGGDPYIISQSVGFNYQFHINPRWSVGLKYSYISNELTDEARSLQDDPNAELRRIPQIDYAKESSMALVNWYPIYGKFALLNAAVIHFDMYLVGGYGNITLDSGETETFTYGGGVGLWWSKYLTTRFEMRQQHYQVNRLERTDEAKVTSASMSIGLLL